MRRIQVTLLISRDGIKNEKLKRIGFIATMYAAASLLFDSSLSDSQKKTSSQVLTWSASSGSLSIVIDSVKVHSSTGYTEIDADGAQLVFLSLSLIFSSKLRRETAVASVLSENNLRLRTAWNVALQLLI